MIFAIAKELPKLKKCPKMEINKQHKIFLAPSVMCSTDDESTYILTMTFCLFNRAFSVSKETNNRTGAVWIL